MCANNGKTITTYHRKTFYAKITQELRTRPEFPYLEIRRIIYPNDRLDEYINYYNWVEFQISTDKPESAKNGGSLHCYYSPAENTISGTFSCGRSSYTKGFIYSQFLMKLTVISL